MVPTLGAVTWSAGRLPAPSEPSLSLAFFQSQREATGCHPFVNPHDETILPGAALVDLHAMGWGSGWPQRPGTVTVAVVSPPPDDVLPAFPRARRSKGKTRFPGGIRRRWKNDVDGMILEGTINMAGLKTTTPAATISANSTL